MKIIFLVSSLGSGGAERVACSLASQWVARGDKVTLIATYSGGLKSFYEFNAKVKVMLLNDLLPRKFCIGKRYIDRLFSLRRFIFSQNPDVVISFLPNVNIAAVLATRASHIPCIICERSDPAARPIGWVWRLACRFLYRFADVVCVQTEAVAATIHTVYGGLKSIAITPNPLPVDLLPWQVKHRVTVRKSLLSLGRLSHEKRVDWIIAAFADLATRHLDWDLHIYGEGPLLEKLKAQIRHLNLQDRVLLMGTTVKPWEVMADSDAFVMASSYEGFPNALLEAMGIGLACVATDCASGPAEMSRGGTDAVLVAVNDRAGLTSALDHVMSDEVFRINLGLQARVSVRTRYDIDQVMATWDTIFASAGVKV